MTTLRKYETEVTFEMRRTGVCGAETDEDAEAFAVQAFRDDFAEQYDTAPPSASELDVIVVEVA